MTPHGASSARSAPAGPSSAGRKPQQPAGPSLGLQLLSAPVTLLQAQAEFAQFIFRDEAQHRREKEASVRGGAAAPAPAGAAEGDGAARKQQSAPSNNNRAAGLMHVAKIPETRVLEQNSPVGKHQREEGAAAAAGEEDGHEEESPENRF